MKLNKLFTLSLVIFSPSAFAYSCDDAIPYCKEMRSCEQAKFYLNQCNAHRLDRDNDGIPCENICGKGGKKAKKENASDEKKSKNGKKSRK